MGRPREELRTCAKCGDVWLFIPYKKVGKDNIRMVGGYNRKLCDVCFTTTHHYKYRASPRWQ